MSELDGVWEAILSEDPQLIKRVWDDLTDEECNAVLAHLRRMSSEPDWQPAQQQSAATALRLIADMANRF